MCNNYDVHFYTFILKYITPLYWRPLVFFPLSISLYMMPSLSIFVDRFDVGADRYQMPSKGQYWQRHSGVSVTNKERNYPLLFSNDS